jgi:hypothetical protein
MLALLGVPTMGLRTGWGCVRLDDVLVAGSLMMVVVGSQSCGEADSSKRLWLCWSSQLQVRRRQC